MLCDVVLKSKRNVNKRIVFYELCLLLPKCRHKQFGVQNSQFPLHTKNLFFFTMNKQQRIDTYPMHSIVVAGYSYGKVAFYRVVSHNKRTGTPLLQEVHATHQYHSFDPVHSQTTYTPLPNRFVCDSTIERVHVHADHLRVLDSTKQTYSDAKMLTARVWSGQPIVVHEACD